jgi:hypothetical protein
MSDHTNQRLETQSGDVVAYLAPTAEVNPTYDNDLDINGLPDSQGTLVRDLSLFSHEIVFQGVFEHSDNLPQAHQTDLDSLFGGLPVTPTDQVNRIIDFAYQQLGPYNLYDEADEYTATSVSEVDAGNGVYPTVDISQIRPTRNAGAVRRGFTIRLAVGFDEPS